MHTNRLTNIFLILTLLLQGCATYTGPAPDLTLTGDAAKEEVKRFTFKEGFWTQGSWFEMGPYQKAYSMESLKPVIDKVSPEALRVVNEAKTLRTSEWVLLGAAVSALIASGLTDDLSKRQSLGSLSLLSSFGSLGFGLAYYYQLSKAAEIYNKDLRDKLIPGVAFNYRF